MSVPRFVVVLLCALWVVVAGLAVLVQRNNGNIERLDGRIDEVRTFVREVQDVTPEEAQQTEAITEAVKIVPELRIILCEAFPNVPTCASGG
jgi:hypothetical protein